MENSLIFIKVTDNKNLVAETTYNYIASNFSEEEKNNILVSKINPDYMDGIKLSTLDLLIYLNFFSNRSYSDL